MKTTAAVLEGKNKVSLKTYELPEITADELLVKVISNTVCLSTYKAAIRGEEHKRVPDDVSEHPAITGHEFAGVIVQVGANLTEHFQEGSGFVLQPAMGLETGYSAGYSYEYFGGNATYCIIPKIAIELGCVLPYESTYYANASLSEPMSCILGAFHASYHTKQFVYEHEMGIKPGGNLALLGCAGPMGIGAIDYAVNGPFDTKLIVVVDIDETRLARAKELITVEKAKAQGRTLVYLNAKDKDLKAALMQESQNQGYDDVFVFASSPALISCADDILRNDGCLNFFAGPTQNDFKVPFNFYNVHYESTHIVGTSGGSTGDMLESLELSSLGKINPSYMLTHVGGINAAPSTILNLPNIPGGKKIIYPHITMELTAIDDFEQLGADNPLFAGLAEICKRHRNVWNEEAEAYLMNYYGVEV